jgi:hypothetical protein
MFNYVFPEPPYVFPNHVHLTSIPSIQRSTTTTNINYYTLIVYGNLIWHFHGNTTQPRLLSSRDVLADTFLRLS